MKIVDCFTFYNELDLLQYRLATLYNYVDYFVLVEANITHAGHPKPNYYVDNAHLFEKYRDKIISSVISLPYEYPNIDYSKNQQWENENFQRNAIKECLELSQIELTNDDFIIISDLDEIVDPQRLVELRNGKLLAYKGFALMQDMYYYNLHCKNTWFWSKARIVKYEYLLEKKAEEIRQGELPFLENGGWHLSYFGDASFIRNKLLEFGHQEYNSPAYTDENIINERLMNGADLFGRDYVHMSKIEIVHNHYLPPMYNIYLNKYTNRPSICDKPIYVYYHVCCIANWRTIVSRMLFKLKNSGLYDIIKKICVTVLGDNENLADPLFSDPKIVIIFYSPDISQYERPAINNMIEDAKNCESENDEFYVLYMHSKGVKHMDDRILSSNIYDWCELMFYYNVYNHNVCINELNNGASAVGCNLQERGAPLHYSGNFWWSKSSHIKRLPKIVDDYYNTPEFLVTSIDGTYKSLWHSDINHFMGQYPSHLYENNLNIQTMDKRQGVVYYS